MTDWYKIKRILVRQNNQEKQIYPAKYKREPDASRTLLYLPLESDATDMSWNSRTTTTSSVTYTTVGWVTSSHVWTTWWISVWPEWFISASESRQTISFLYYSTYSSTSARRIMFEWRNENVSFCVFTDNWSTYFKFWYVWGDYTIPFTANSWNVITITWDSSAFKFYKNGSLVTTRSWSSTPWRSWTYTTVKAQNVMCWRDWPSYWESCNWNMRELIFENKVRTAQEVSDYYTWIKDKLWF